MNLNNTIETKIIEVISNPELSELVKIKLLKIYRTKYKLFTEKAQFNEDFEVGYCIAVFEGIKHIDNDVEIAAYRLFFACYLNEGQLALFKRACNL